jgi:preprotein translocase subunit SecF
MPSLTSLLQFRVNRHRRLLWTISGLALLLSVVGLAASWLSPAIGSPLRPGLDFTGGTQIELIRRCEPTCAPLTVSQLEEAVRGVTLPADDRGGAAPDLRGVAVQLLEEGRQVTLRLPTLNAAQGQALVDQLRPGVGDLVSGGLSVETIGPSLGDQLLRSSLVSLLVSFVGIALYITFRYDRIYAALALLCLAHDVLITCGAFAWLGLLAGVEVNSLFAVALLTIAGYSVNDTVVIFDRIREKRQALQGQPLSDQADVAVQATLTRSLYTSFTTLLPLIALILFGGSTLFWFAVALSIGVVVGSWSSISVAPTLLPLLYRR